MLMSLKVFLIGSKKQDMLEYLIILIIVSIVFIGIMSFLVLGNHYNKPATIVNITVQGE